MPRHARLDAPDTLHHVMVRGLERRTIFRDDPDRDDFVGRVAALAEQGAWTVYAWALLPNHATPLGPDRDPSLPFGLAALVRLRGLAAIGREAPTHRLRLARRTMGGPRPVPGGRRHGLVPPAELAQACVEIAGLVEQFCGGQIRCELLSQDPPRMSLSA